MIRLIAYELLYCFFSQIFSLNCSGSADQLPTGSVIFVLTYFLVLVLVFQLFLSFSLVSVLHYFFVSVFVFDVMLK